MLEAHYEVRRHSPDWTDAYSCSRAKRDLAKKTTTIVVVLSKSRRHHIATLYAFETIASNGMKECVPRIPLIPMLCSFTMEQRLKQQVRLATSDLYFLYYKSSSSSPAKINSCVKTNTPFLSCPCHHFHSSCGRPPTFVAAGGIQGTIGPQHIQNGRAPFVQANVAQLVATNNDDRSSPSLRRNNSNNNTDFSQNVVIA